LATAAYFSCDNYFNSDTCLSYLGKLETFVADVDGPQIISGDFCWMFKPCSSCHKLLFFTHFTESRRL